MSQVEVVTVTMWGMASTIRDAAVAVGVSVTLTFAIAGCSSSSNQSTTTTTNKSFQVNTPDGQVSVSLSGQLPPNWPSGFPVPSGATPAGSGSIGNASSGTKVAVYTTNASPPETFTYYAENSGLSTSGARSAGVGSTYVGSMKITAPYTGSVTVVGHDTATYIVVVLTGSTTTTT